MTKPYRHISRGFAALLTIFYIVALAGLITLLLIQKPSKVNCLKLQNQARILAGDGFWAYYNQNSKEQGILNKQLAKIVLSNQKCFPANLIDQAKQI